jgi:hypothetical protein
MIDKISFFHNETRPFGENPRAPRSYSEQHEMICVDTIRKLVIIAVGGKIGNPLLTCMFQQTSEQERIEELHPLVNCEQGAVS